nr:MAG TPA: hypothetical protein [Caudoviricetes sp.]
MAHRCPRRAGPKRGVYRDQIPHPRICRAG